MVEIGAGLQSYRVGDTDVTCPYPTDALPPRACGTTLVPWPNRIRGARYDFDGATQQLAASEPDKGNAIHGLGRWSRWSRVRRGGDGELTLRFDVPPQKGYPFLVRCETTYRLDASDGLTVTLTARNRGDVPAPFGAGQHPYLATHGHRIDDVTLQLPARTGIDLDDKGIPVGAHRLAGAGRLPARAAAARAPLRRRLHRPRPHGRPSRLRAAHPQRRHPPVVRRVVRVRRRSSPSTS